MFFNTDTHKQKIGDYRLVLTSQQISNNSSNVYHSVSIKNKFRHISCQSLYNNGLSLSLSPQKTLMWMFFSELQYEEHLLNEMKNTDRKIQEFNENLFFKISEMSAQDLTFNDILSADRLIDQNTFGDAIDRTERLILEGIADDIDLEKGLNAILDLGKLFNSSTDISLLDVIRAKVLLNKWFDGMGLKYSNTESDNQSFRENIILNSLVKFRFQVREVALKSLKASKGRLKDEKLFQELENNDKTLLSLCDSLRQDLDGFGIKLKVSSFRTPLKQYLDLTNICRSVIRFTETTVES